MSEAQKPKDVEPGSRKKGCGCVSKSLALLFLALLLIGLVLPPSGSFQELQELVCVDNAEFIAHALQRYAKDHHGEFPTGNSSTELFQKLIDGHYAGDPRIFCGTSWWINSVSGPYRGKLKPEDVWYDVSVPVDSTSPAHLPIVFLTGYRVDYSPGGSAVPLSNSKAPGSQEFMAVFYKDKTAALIPGYHWGSFGRGVYYLPGPPYACGKPAPLWPGDTYNYTNAFDDMPTNPLANERLGLLGGKMLSDGTIVNFVPTDFNASGTTYRQLTPYGPLSP